MNESFIITPQPPNEPENTLQSQSMQNQPMQNQFMQRNYNRNFPQKPAEAPILPECAMPPEKECPAPSPVCPVSPECIAYQAAMPYPLIKPSCKNPRYAAAMLDNLGGQNSEMSAIGFYFYNHMTVYEWKEIAETFHHISIVEMHHMEIFGRLAMALGENPRLWSPKGRNGQYVYWSPSYIPYGPFPVGAAIKKLLSEAIKGEQNSVSKYMQQTTWITDSNVSDNLLRIAADEQVHIEILTRLFHKF